jgi:hypothetical protein
MTQADRLDAIFSDLNRMRTGLLEWLAAMPADDLTRQPGPNRWSLLQVVEHLVLSERLVLQGLPAPSRLVHRNQNPINRINYAIVMLILKWNIPVPVPSPQMVPDGRIPFKKLRNMWDRNLQWLGETIAELGADAAHLAVFRHPVAGPLTPVQALRMDRLHLESHVRQINRIQRLLKIQKA